MDHPISELDYVNIQPQIETLITLARIANLGIYVIDYHKQNFLYVSSNPLFLCGYDREEVQKMGYELLFMFSHLNFRQYF